MMLSIGVETELEALDGESKPLLTLQESVPEQAAPSCLEFPGISIVSQSHHRNWAGREEGKDVGSVRPRLPWRFSR
jgi:hypothetical protein